MARRTGAGTIGAVEGIKRGATAVRTARASDFTVFMYMGEDRAGYIVERDRTATIFMNPRHRLTEDYVSGRFG